MCRCKEYDHLEFSRELVDKRIKETPSLKKEFSKLSTFENKTHILYSCPSCNQFWQSSYAWNWGSKEYIFKVPEIEINEWQKQPYVQPDELLIFCAVTGKFLYETPWNETDQICIVENCNRNTVFMKKCLQHHFEGLQKTKAMPQYPEGRWFTPYEKHNIFPRF